MTEKEAQFKLLGLTDTFHSLLDVSNLLDEEAESVNEERRKILEEFPTLFLGGSLRYLKEKK